CRRAVARACPHRDGRDPRCHRAGRGPRERNPPGRAELEHRPEPGGARLLHGEGRSPVLRPDERPRGPRGPGAVGVLRGRRAGGRGGRVTLTIAVAHIPFTHFQVPIEEVVLGLVTGLTYALLGVGLVMIYKTSRVLNFAHGEMGALGAGFIPWLVIRHHTPYWLAFVLAIAVAAGAGALTELVLIRKLSRTSRLIVMVG